MSPVSAGDLLEDLNSGESRFKVTTLLKEGRSFFVALGQDTHLEDMQVVLKSIRYEGDTDAEAANERRDALNLELEALTVPTSLLPEPIDYIEVDSDMDKRGREPVLVLEYISGKTLREEVARGKGGIEPPRALAMIRELALGLQVLHEHGFVYRDLNPDHVIVGFDDNIHLVGTGNIARAQTRPFKAKTGVSGNYTAPEIRHELTGKFIGPKADIYSLGALFVFLLTGVDPTDKIESPLDATAYKRLLGLKSEGYRLIVGKCIQPMAKNRFKNTEEMLGYLTQATLPGANAKGFSKSALPAPFDLNEENRATNSKISSGPLISVTSDKNKPADKEGAITKPEQTAPAVWYRSCLPWLSASVLLFTALAAALASI